MDQETARVAHDQPSPAVSERTRARMAALERSRPHIDRPVQHAIGFVLGVAALAAMLDHFEPWEER